ncbi:MAG: CAP domain-containing protein [Candidatus Electrothrix sp. GW3-4]|uniref:CAP domain-containing protein n=1 Tax=Candidatus Electrothrix sp. GW3-4 TaxID=3126740 RepID=UPI0030CAA9D0
MSLTTTGPSNAAGEHQAVDSAAMTAAHNQWRAKTGVPHLKWSTILAGSAQEWAKHLAQTGCNMQHSTTAYGENIFWAGPLSSSNGTSSVQEITEQNVVDAWGNEVQYYNYANNSCHGVCGHYTQVVWKSTKEVGCGMALCPDKGQIWVCQYNPQGNLIGQKPY